jgi:hypothetical protein
MKSKIFTLVILALLCASCHDSDDDGTERYVGEWMSVTQGSTIQEQWFVLPEEVTSFFKPDTVIINRDSIYHEIDTSEPSSTKGDDLLTINGNMAKLDVNSTTTGQVDNEIAIRKEYYLVFKAGTYNNVWNTFVVKPDGIFLVSNNERFLQLDNFRYKMNYLTERDTISTKSITVRKSFSAQSSVNKDGVLLFSRNDTTFRVTKKDEGYYLEMIKPSDNDFYNHTMDKK